MQTYISSTFMDSKDRLTAQEARMASDAALNLMRSAKHPSLQYHRLEGTRDPNFWSARVNDDIRLIIHQNNGARVLCYVDHHDAAYRWAERHILEEHPRTGAASFVDIGFGASDPSPPPAENEQLTSRIFGKLTREDLLSVGVPRNMVAAVLNADEEAFLNLIDHLPEEAAEALGTFEEHGFLPKPPESNLTDKRNPLRHRDARRRFRIMANETELEAALHGDWANWRVFLHPTQQDVVDREFNGPARVTGAAGTGKTVVALHRALRLAGAADHNRVLLTTFSRALAARMADNMKLLAGTNAPELERIHIVNLHHLAADIFTEVTGEKFRMANGKDRDELFQSTLDELGVNKASAAAVIAEWDRIVNEEGVTTWEEYRAISRTGRGKPMNPQQREDTWRHLEILTTKLAESGLKTAQQLCRTVTRHIADNGTRYTHVIADEMQDFGPPELRLLKALSGPTEQLFLTGDIGQRIYRGRTSFRTAGIELRGRTVRLNVNYRTTQQIRTFADRFMPSQLPDLDEDDMTERQSISLMNGAHPEIIRSNLIQQEIDRVAEWIQSLLSRGYKAAEIGIFVRRNDMLAERVEPVIGRLGLKAYRISNESPPTSGHISVGTMHSAKGQEFMVVALMGVEDQYLPMRSVVEAKVDAADREAFIEQERNLLYVACTRARERLLVSSANTPSRFLTGA